MAESFRPAPWARSPHFQTIFGSLKLRVWGRNEMTAAAQEIILDTGNGVRLLGYHSRQYGRTPKGMIILLHGWEGSADSSYILSTGRFFYRRGYDIFRLNLRDHGKSHSLNRGLFHGALTEETARAVGHISRFMPGKPSYLIGFSLGGNFALRIALRQFNGLVSNLRRVFAISPALDPYKSTLAIDEGLAAYRLYFLAKWKRSLREKQRLFPDLYDFSPILTLKTCMGMTQALMSYYTEFNSYRDYFHRYTLTGNALSALGMPVTIITSSDDPVVSVEDFRHLPSNNHLQIIIQRHGGHCGFLDPFPWGCWYERYICNVLQSDEQGQSL
jgi:uncharacterized protein